MAKRKDVLYVCDECGYDSPKWMGQCPNCSAWNSMREARGIGALSKKEVVPDYKISKIDKIVSKRNVRISTPFSEMNRVLGGYSERNPSEKGGIVPGEIILLSGDPGVGKSTILLQLALSLSKKKSSQKAEKNEFRVLYVTGEESESQVKIRAERIVGCDKLDQYSLSLLATTDTDVVMDAMSKEKWGLVIVDSIQTVASSSLSGFAGSIPQIRYATSQFVALGKGEGIPIFLVGHVTKEGVVAGPQTLSHMVDCVLYLEGEDNSGTRVLRAYKNRFGDTSEVGIFLMEENGLKEMSDLSSFFMDSRDKSVAGSCLTVVMEGSRPLLVEIQALCVPSGLAFPRRVANGVDSRRLELLLAVLQKHVGLRVDKLDIFVNVVGGLKIGEVASDLAVCLAVASSLRNKALGKVVALAEVGLLGELKNVPSLDMRIRESKRFGVKNVIDAKKHHFLSEIISRVL